MKRAWGWLALLWCLNGWGVEPLVAMHPLVVLEGDAAETGRLQRFFAADIERRNIDQVPAACVAGFLKTVPRSSCAADEGCLAKLAQVCGASRGVYVAAVVYPGKVVLSGKVVRAGGLTERTVSGIEVRRRLGPAGDNELKAGLRQFLTEDLKVDALELGPLVEPPVATVAAAQKGPSVLRIVGYSVGGAAVATAVAGGAVWVASLGPRRELETLVDANGFIRAGDTRAQALDRSLNNQSRWTTGLLIGAGALAVSSVVLILVSRDPAPATQVSVGASDREIGLQVSGRF